MTSFTSTSRLAALLASLIAALALAACSSGVKLDETTTDNKIESRTGTGMGTTSGNQSGSSPGGSNSADSLSTVTKIDAGDALKETTGPLSKRSIYFEYDSFIIKDEFRSVVEAHAKYLNGNKARRVVVQGNTDERGGREYNLALGQKRAEVVRKALMTLGVSDAQIEAVSFGEEKPKSTGTDESALAENRRADLAY